MRCSRPWRCASALGAVYGLDGLPQTAAPAIDWGDGVLYDRARIWAEQRELVDAGLLRPELALAWYFDLPHETEAELAEIRRGLWAMQGGRNEPAVQCGGVRSPRPTMLQKVR